MTAVVASPQMLDLLDLAARVARSNASVLILGESGSGKELVARAIHQLSLRCHQPWVDISCGAIPEHLVESELFGYEKGAFSGASATKPGLFELAHSGSLFLDEVGELDPRMQVKLLRVLDGAAYYRLGGTRKVSVDVRIIAATNAELELAVADGTVRRDLYHRLSQVTLRVPPLRDRIDDIPVLARFFLSRQDPGLSFSPDAEDALCHFNWPGNVRELRNVVTRSAIFATSGIITRQHLGLPLRPETSPASLLNANRSGPNASLDGVERDTILRVLTETNGHRQRAAGILGISRRTLSRKLKLYRIAGETGLSDTIHGLTRAENWNHDRQLSGKTA